MAWASHTIGDGTPAPRGPLRFTGSEHDPLVLETEVRDSMQNVGSIALFEWANVGPDLAVRRERSHEVALALRSGVNSKWVVCQPEAGADPEEIQFDHLVDCHLGRIHTLAEAGVKVVEFMFGRQLERGQTHAFGYDVHYPAAPAGNVPERAIIRGFSRPVDSYNLVVHFHHHMPHKIEQVHQASPQSVMKALRTLELFNARAHLSLPGPITGGHGMRWS